MTAPRCTVTPLEALRRLIAEVKQLDAVEVGARWNQLQGELGVAEGVVRDYVEPDPVGYVQIYMGGSVGVRSAGLHALADGTPLYAAPLPEAGSAAPAGEVANLSFLEPLYRWMARVQFVRAADEMTAANFAQQIRAAITATKE